MAAAFLTRGLARVGSASNLMVLRVGFYGLLLCCAAFAGFCSFLSLPLLTPNLSLTLFGSRRPVACCTLLLSASIVSPWFSALAERTYVNAHCLMPPDTEGTHRSST